MIVLTLVFRVCLYIYTYELFPFSHPSLTSKHYPKFRINTEYTTPTTLRHLQHLPRARKMFSLSTFWACNHLRNTEVIKLKPSRSPNAKYLNDIPLRPAVKYLRTSCRDCLDIPTTSEVLTLREHTQRFIAELVNAEANRIKKHYLREVKNADKRQKRAVRAATNRTRKAWKVQHGKCEGCGSMLKQQRRDHEPVCAAKCHALWKHPVKESEPVVAPPSWDEVADKYLRKGRSSRDSMATHSSE